MHIRPPGFKADRWDDLSVQQQSELLAFSQIRSLEEAELASAGMRL